LTIEIRRSMPFSTAVGGRSHETEFMRWSNATLTKVAIKLPSLTKKRVSPHTIRHTTATHLYQAGVDINTIRAWLGHESLSSTYVYAEVDLKMKAQALLKCEIKNGKPTKPWRKNPGLMEFLRTL